MESLVQRLEELEAAVCGEIEVLREQIEVLSARLADAENRLSRLRITRETLLALDVEADDHVVDPVASVPAYRQILAVFEHADTGLRAKDLCQALDLGQEPKQIEGMRYKLKRLVARGILSELKPGLFAVPAPDVDA